MRCDLKKAFDCVNRNILLTKLEFYEVTETLKLIKPYLKCRYQKVILDNNLPNSNSDWGETGMVSHGDEYLVHCFFLVYLHDLPKIVKDNAEVVL
jgi:hypothetical protein